MTPLVKALLAVALVVPLVAYVAGSLASNGGETPEQQGTVFIDDVEPASETTSPAPGRTSGPTPSPPRSSPTRDNQPTQAPGDDPDDKEARVVTPAPVEDDDDERDDDQDDDTDDGDDTDD